MTNDELPVTRDERDERDGRDERDERDELENPEGFVDARVAEFGACNGCYVRELWSLAHQHLKLRE